MNEILMQTLIEKSEAQQKDIQELKEIIRTSPDHQEDFARLTQKMDEVQKACREIPGLISIPEGPLQQLSGTLIRHGQQLEQPLKKEVRHHHYLDKALIATIVLSALMTVLVVLLVNAWSRIAQNKESDIKYRYLQLFGNAPVQKAIHFTDSLYIQDADSIEKSVQQEELHRKEQAEMQEKLREQQQAVDRLKDQIHKDK